MKGTIDAPVSTIKQKAVKRRHVIAIIHKLAGQIITRLFLITMSLLFLVPLYWMLITALKSTPELTIFPPTFWPLHVQWSNFIQAYTYISFGTYFVNSVIITALVVIGTVLSNLVVAYGFACIRWPGRDQIFYLLIATLFIPLPIAIIPLFDLFASLHWVNTFLPLVVPPFFASAFYVFLLRQFLLQTPYELIEAARIDGASELQILWRVIVPIARPAIAVVAIFAAIGAWNDFTGPLIYLQDDSLRTLAVGLIFFRSTHDIQFNLLMAASLMSVLPVIILFLVFQRFFVRAVTLGSIR
ncbi:MAG TPA: carbohydrate ABC transporter permease [Ktedonobacteraceae bacterium]|nr:carbohydrate ABC transporter permease [Ktedonobacteraceae bacterium]